MWTSRTHDCKAGCICTKMDEYSCLETNSGCLITGHSDYVLCVAFSADGKFIVSGSRDKLVKIWNADTGDMVSILG